MVDVDDHIAVDMSATIAAAIDVTAHQTTDIVIGGIGRVGGYEIVLSRIPDGCVPIQFQTDSSQLIVRVLFGGGFITFSNKLGMVQVGLIILLACCQGATGNLVKRIGPASGLYKDIIEIQLQTVLDISIFGIACPFVGRAQ